MREVVLGAFHALGDGGPGRPVEQGGAPARDVRGAVAVADPWEAAVIDAWGEFAVRVEAALRALPEQDLVEFRLPERAVGGQQVRAELWFRALPGGALEAGVMTEGNVVELGDLFDAAQISTLDELGWVVSRVSAGGEPEPVRAQLRGDRAGAERLALVAVAAMRQVFGTVHPSFVTAGGRWPSAGGGAEDDDLVAEDAYSGPNRQGTIVHDVGGAEGLRALVDRALAEMLGAEAWHDEDGDVPIDLGGSTCYVRARRTARS